MYGKQHLFTPSYFPQGHLVQPQSTITAPDSLLQSTRPSLVEILSLLTNIYACPLTVQHKSLNDTCGERRRKCTQRSDVTDITVPAKPPPPKCQRCASSPNTDRRQFFFRSRKKFGEDNSNKMMTNNDPTMVVRRSGVSIVK